jgi:DNA-binding NtrC family response regulator
MQDQVHREQEGIGAGVTLEGAGVALRGRRAGNGDAVSHEKASAGGRRDLRTLLDEYERRLILLALHASDGHQRRAAASLGVLPSTLSEKMKRLGLRTPVRARFEDVAAEGERAAG